MLASSLHDCSGFEMLCGYDFNFESVATSVPVHERVQQCTVRAEIAAGSAVSQGAEVTATHELESATFSVEMSDGVTLACSRVCALSSPAPAIVMLTPYRKEPVVSAVKESGWSAETGCHFVIADVRGIGGSGGDWDGPVSPREISDGVELLAWVAEQDFCDGQTAVVGGSYLGLNTLLIAARRPHSLRCIVSSVPPGDFYRDWIRRGGIPSHTNWGALVAYSNQHRPEVQQRVLSDYYLATVADPLDGDRFRSRSAEYVLGDIDVPALITGGWHDYFLRGTIRAFRAIQAPKRLVIGNWGHGGDPETLGKEQTRWLRHWLLGEGEDPSRGRHVVLQDAATGTWESHEAWPSASDIRWERWQPVATPTSIPVPITFETLPTSEPPVDALEHAGTNSGMGLWGEAWTADTVAVNEPTSYRGYVALRAVFVSDEASDFDLHARISIVRADESIQQITEGRLRASHRALEATRCETTPDGEIVVPWHAHDRAEPLPLDEPIALEVEIFPINLELAPGESLRLGVTLIRMDDVVAPTQVTLLPETSVLLPAVAA